jgi:hypothetical protein
MNASIFQIEYKKLAKQLLPVRLRNAITLAYSGAFIWYLQWIYNAFKTNRAANLYRLKITPQVVYLEKLLNDRYDIALRRITIDDTITHDALYIYQRDEAKPLPIYLKSENKPVYLYRAEETDLNPVDFTISIPSDIAFQEAELRAMVDSYKLAGKTYIIKII